MGPGCGRRSAATRGESGLTSGESGRAVPASGEPGRAVPACASPDGPACGEPGRGDEGVPGRGEAHGEVSAELAESTAIKDWL